MCGAAASATLHLEKCTGGCQTVEYCSGRDCQALHRGQHEEGCDDIKYERINKAIDDSEYASLYDVAEACDEAAARALMAAGVDYNWPNEEGTTLAMYAAAEGCLDAVVFLVETCGADLSHTDDDGHSAVGAAALNGHLETVRYLTTATPTLIDVPDLTNGTSPIMYASCMGHTATVRHLARLGCSLSRTCNNGHTALHAARSMGRHDTARLISDITSAGGWHQYVDARRMAYVRIRYKVSSTYLVLPEDHKLRELLHFLFGKNKVLEGGEEEPRRTRARDRLSSLIALPDAVFSLVCRFLET